MTCQQFEARLPEYMEGDLQGDERIAFERHAESCDRCRPILEDLNAIVASAGALGPIEPSRDLWSGIESRISAQVVPLAPRRVVPLARGLAAAVVLMAATAGITWQLAKGNRTTVTAAAPASSHDTSAAATVAPLGGTIADAASSDQSPSGPGPLIPPTKPPQVAINNSPDRSTRSTEREPSSAAIVDPSVQAVRNSGRAVNASVVYDREITRLHAVIASRRGELDPKTVAAIERSLAVIDTAIAQARSALAADPASRFLHGRLNDVLDKKVELLRTTAMLPARS
jgi:hypothetical protein